MEAYFRIHWKRADINQTLVMLTLFGMMEMSWDGPGCLVTQEPLFQAWQPSCFSSLADEFNLSAFVPFYILRWKGSETNLLISTNVRKQEESEMVLCCSATSTAPVLGWHIIFPYPLNFTTVLIFNEHPLSDVTVAFPAHRFYVSSSTGAAHRQKVRGRPSTLWSLSDATKWVLR